LCYTGSHLNRLYRKELMIRIGVLTTSMSDCVSPTNESLVLGAIAEAQHGSPL